MQTYFNKSADQTLKQLGVTIDGLRSDEAREREKKFGKNVLVQGKRKSVLRIFLEQFKDLLVLILIAAGVISSMSGQEESTLVIFAVLLLNAVLGTVQYFKAEKSLESLRALSSPSAKVRRDGFPLEVPSADVMPGDIVQLEAGDLVVADGRVLENFSLKVNESSLTGESEPVDKTEQTIEGENVALGDRKNMVFSGSLVTYGRATVVVTGTGMDTELGKIASLMNATQQRKTPLQVSLDKFSQKLAILIMAICAVVFGLSLYHDMSIVDAMMFAVALAVAAIPEALSSIVTIVLALGTQKMASENAIIKDLKAVESLGAVSVICSDKTGTLTQNRMTTRKLYVDGRLIDEAELTMANAAHNRLLKMAILVNDATSTDDQDIGDPTEVALVNLAERVCSVEENSYRHQHPRIGELAFDSDRKLMSTVHDLDGVRTLFTKGAIDVLLARAVNVMTKDGVRPITQAEKDDILKTNQELSSQGLRLLGFAFRELDSGEEISLECERGYAFVGLISMIDPPREESMKAVLDAKGGGISTIMITGDHKITASAIAKQIGILSDGDMALEGTELDAMTDEQLDEILPRVRVYARVSPEHKIRIVHAWQRRGCIVAMTGDGVNDAPALKKADIGVAMGITGTEVSKDAASMILTDDNFATIVKAVVNGRSVYANIINAIKFLLSGNMAGILCVLYTSLIGLPAPFAPVHLLFINLVTDSLPAIAIGMESARPGLLRQKPRDPKEPILSSSLLKSIGIQGFLIAVATMAAFYIGLRESSAVAMTMAFSTMTLARLFHSFNCRGRQSIIKLGLFSNRFSIMAFCAGAALLAAVLFVPGLKRLLIVSAVSAGALGWIALLAVLPTVIIQAFKSVRELAGKNK